jgi:hypothetical protein
MQSTLQLLQSAAWGRLLTATAAHLAAVVEEDMVPAGFGERGEKIRKKRSDGD